MRDTKIGRGKKDDAADVAQSGFKAMTRGDGDVVKNKLQSAIANVTLADVLAEMHRKKAEPGAPGSRPPTPSPAPRLHLRSLPVRGGCGKARPSQQLAGYRPAGARAWWNWQTRQI
jgi:hypothetical protein